MTQDFVSETDEKQNAKRQEIEFQPFSFFLHDCHLLNVPIYFLHESLGLDLSQLLGGTLGP